MDVDKRQVCNGWRMAAAFARAVVFAVSVLSARCGFGEGIAFSSSWSTYFSHNDIYPADSVNALTLSDNTLFLAGVLGSSHLFGNDGDSKVANNVDTNVYESFASDAFAARLSASGGTGASPVFSLLEPDDDTPLNVFNAVAVSGGMFVSAGAYETDTAEGIAEATVVCYDTTDATTLDETWRRTLSCGADSAFRAVALADDGSVYAAGWTACATNGCRAGGLVYKFDSTGGVVWSNLLGGGVSCRVNACAVSDDALYLAGTATNGEGATVGFLKRLSASDGTEAYAETFDDAVAALAVAPDGGLLLGYAGTLCKLGDSGSGFTTLWSTNLSASASISALAVDASNRVAVAGSSTTAWFTATDGTSCSGTGDGFVVLLPSDGDGILFSSWIGGDGETTADAVAFTDEVLAVGGSTKATDLASGGFCETNWNCESRWSDEDDYEPCGYVKVWLGETFIPNPPGALQVILQPSGAVDAGGAWSVDGGATWYESGALVDLTEGTYTLTYREVDEYTLPESPLSVTLESGVTNVLYATYPEQVKPFVTRYIDGTNITLRLVLPEGIITVEIEETLPDGLEPEGYDTEYWRWRSARSILQYTLDLVSPSSAGQTVYATFSVNGEPGTYYLNGTAVGEYAKIYAQDNTNAIVYGEATVTIPDPASSVVPPSPDITAFAYTAAGWQLTFVSTQNVTYAVLTNATPVFGGAEYTTVEGGNGTTTVTLSPSEPRLFFKVQSR